MKSRNNKSSQDLAEDRTDLAEDRTIMANERTFAGWLRTGLASIGVGLGFEAIFGRIDAGIIPKLIASGFIAIGIIITFTAYRRAIRLFSRLSPHHVSAPDKRDLLIVTTVVIIGAFTLIMAIWKFDWTA